MKAIIQKPKETQDIKKKMSKDLWGDKERDRLRNIFSVKWNKGIEVHIYVHHLQKHFSAVEFQFG